jgi:hypothetical protein
MVKERSGISAAQAASDVRVWMQGKDISSPETGLQSTGD